jgi:hypothetical protein
VVAYVRSWLDDEWAVPELEAAHAALASAAGAAFDAARRGGDDGAAPDVGSVLLSVAAELTGHPALADSFTDAFEVANKVSELLVFAASDDVCCAGAADVARLRAAVGPLREGGDGGA